MGWDRIAEIEVLMADRDELDNERAIASGRMVAEVVSQLVVAMAGKG